MPAMASCGSSLGKRLVQLAIAVEQALMTVQAFEFHASRRQAKKRTLPSEPMAASMRSLPNMRRKLVS
jgi:hypothetical protein